MIFGIEFGCVVYYRHSICKFIANNDIWTSHYLKNIMILLYFEFCSVRLCYIAHHPSALFVGPRFCQLFPMNFVFTSTVNHRCV